MGGIPILDGYWLFLSLGKNTSVEILVEMQILEMCATTSANIVLLVYHLPSFTYCNSGLVKNPSINSPTNGNLGHLWHQPPTTHLFQESNNIQPQSSPQKIQTPRAMNRSKISTVKSKVNIEAILRIQHGRRILVYLMMILGDDFMILGRPPRFFWETSHDSWEYLGR